MNGIDYLILVLVLGILALAGLFIFKSKKSGKKCIGCPDSCACSNSNCTGGCAGGCCDR